MAGSDVACNPRNREILHSAFHGHNRRVAVASANTAAMSAWP
jgi:hypothetical protein